MKIFVKDKVAMSIRAALIAGRRERNRRIAFLRGDIYSESGILIITGAEVLEYEPTGTASIISSGAVAGFTMNKLCAGESARQRFPVGYAFYQPLNSLSESLANRELRERMRRNAPDKLALGMIFNAEGKYRLHHD